MPGQVRFHHDLESDQDGMKIIVTRGVTLSMGALERSLNELKGLYKDKFGPSWIRKSIRMVLSSSPLVEQLHPWLHLSEA